MGIKQIKMVIPPCTKLSAMRTLVPFNCCWLLVQISTKEIDLVWTHEACCEEKLSVLELLFAVGVNGEPTRSKW